MFEAGCGGFAGNSLFKVYILLDIAGAAKRKAIKPNMAAPEWASRWLWTGRTEAG